MRFLPLRPTQSIMYIPFHVNICHKSILLILQYNDLKSYYENFIFKNPTKISFSAQDHAVLLLLINIVGFFISARQKSSFCKFVTHSCTEWKGHVGGPLNIFK